MLFCKLSQTSDKDKFLANHFVLLINKSNYNLSVLKRCIEVSQHSHIKRPKKAVETSPFVGKNIFDYFKATPPISTSGSGTSSSSIPNIVTSSSTVITSTTGSMITTAPSSTVYCSYVSSVYTNDLISIFFSKSTPVSSVMSKNTPISSIIPENDTSNDKVNFADNMSVKTEMPTTSPEKSNKPSASIELQDYVAPT